MRYRKSNWKKQRTGILLILILCLCAAGYAVKYCMGVYSGSCPVEIPPYVSDFVIPVNGDRPLFTDEEITDEAFLSFSNQDRLQRCHAASACLGPELFPTQQREEIGMVKPSGWHTVRYDDLIEDRYLYNRCHLIAFMLSGENANEKNLITGTRYLNISGMLPLEITVHDYMERTGNHVMYRVTPVYQGLDLVAYGVLMEALSVEDGGRGICFCRFVYNIQPGITIDYTTGDSRRS